MHYLIVKIVSGAGSQQEEDEDQLLAELGFHSQTRFSSQPAGPLINSLSPLELEIERYRDLPGPKTLKDDPLKWWKKHATILPLLSEHARQWLCIPATSAECERIFSKGGDIQTKRRIRLKSANLANLIYVYFNLGRLIHCNVRGDPKQRTTYDFDAARQNLYDMDKYADSDIEFDTDSDESDGTMTDTEATSASSCSSPSVRPSPNPKAVANSSQNRGKFSNVQKCLFFYFFFANSSQVKKIFFFCCFPLIKLS